MEDQNDLGGGLPPPPPQSFADDLVKSSQNAHHAARGLAKDVRYRLQAVGASAYWEALPANDFSRYWKLSVGG